mgnify:CR=1 FL=1
MRYRLMLVVAALVASSAAQAQLLGPQDTPESLAQIRRECAGQPDPAGCYRYLNQYEASRRETARVMRSLNSGFSGSWYCCGYAVRRY